MKIIAISDTHIKSGSIQENLPAELPALLKDADIIIHAGDFVTENVFDELSELSRLEAVHGNLDDQVLRELLPERKVIEVEGMSIGIIHEASLSIQDTAGAWYMAKEMGVDVLVFGHVHKPVIEKSQVLLICPGSPTVPRLSEPSAVEMNIQDGKISGKIITLEGTRCSALEKMRIFGE